MTVSIKVTKCNLVKGDLRRIPRIIVNVSSKRSQSSYQIICQYGTIKEKFYARQLLPLYDTSEVNTDGGVVSFVYLIRKSPVQKSGFKRCRCKTGCSNKRCPCKALRRNCTLHCHNGMKCKNFEKNKSIETGLNSNFSNYFSHI